MPAVDAPPPESQNPAARGDSRPVTREELDHLREEMRKDIRAVNESFFMLVIALLIGVVGGVVLGTLISVFR